jgi:predicted RNase H-like nuclease (RuvC/YqgF family)
MKKLSLLLISILFSLKLLSQIDYPIYQIDSLGQTVVVMTIEQAQKLDNNSELLSLFEKLNSQILNYDSVCIKAINEKEYVVTTQKIEISKLKESINIKDQKIVTLQKEIIEYKKKIDLLEDQLLNRNDLIKVKDEEIGRLKIKMAIGGSASGLAIIGLIIGLILIK